MHPPSSIKWGKHFKTHKGDVYVLDTCHPSERGAYWPKCSDFCFFFYILDLKSWASLLCLKPPWCVSSSPHFSSFPRSDLSHPTSDKVLQKSQNRSRRCPGCMTCVGSMNNKKVGFERLEAFREIFYGTLDDLWKVWEVLSFLGGLERSSLFSILIEEALQTFCVLQLLPLWLLQLQWAVRDAWLRRNRAHMQGPAIVVSRGRKGWGSAVGVAPTMPASERSLGHLHTGRARGSRESQSNFEVSFGSLKSPLSISKALIRTHRIGANPEKSDLVNFRGPNWRKFSELRVLLFFQGKIDKIFPIPRFSKPTFGHSAGSTKLDRPYCKQFQSQFLRSSQKSATSEELSNCLQCSPLEISEKLKEACPNL